MSTLRIQRSLDVRHDVDVFVAGGGPAGAAAAIAAARGGAKVFLAEAGAAFGGMGTLGLVPAFMPLGDDRNVLCAGIGAEIILRMLAADPASAQVPLSPRQSGSYPIFPEALKRAYDALVAEAGVDFTFGTHLVDVVAGNGRVEAAILWAKSGLFAVRAKVFVDATGDGDLCAWAGAPYEEGDETGTCMPGTLCSQWHRIDWDRVASEEMLWKQGAFIEQAFRDGVFSVCDKHLPGMWRVGEDLGGGNIGHAFALRATDERSVTKALLDGRKLVLEYRKYYRDYVKSGFSDAELVATASEMGVRESRRILGDYILVVDDFLRRASFEDEIGRNNYPVDIHVMKPDSEEEFQRFQKEFGNLRMGSGESYGIPYRALVPQRLENVLVAGRCISADRSIQASIRVMPCCYVTGQAAGAAAALASRADGETRSVDVPALQDALRALGAYIP
ncbi:MAG: FAD-dependent oxidoreductase [Kiritimatiellia bacterium]|jgi:hypothetical protein